MYLIASKSGKITGKKLAQNLGLNFRTSIDNIPGGSIVAVRYGFYGTNHNIAKDTTLNSPDAIKIMSYKHTFYNAMQDLGIIVPQYFKTSEVVDFIFPALSRKRLHRGGNDIVVCRDMKDIPYDSEFMVPYIETNREYRVHVLNGKVTKIMRKVPGDKIDIKEIPQIRSAIRGWKYKLSSIDKIACGRSMIEVALKAVNKVGCFFTGIDMGWSQGKKQWIIFEMNSAPSLNTNSLEIYVDTLGRMIDELYKPK